MKINSCRLASATWLAFAILLMLVLCGVAQAQTFTVIHAFNGTDGRAPQSSPILDKYGALYGTTWGGGALNFGTVYRLGNANGSWILTPLYNFNANNGIGGLVVAGVTFGPDGSLFGASNAALFNLKPGSHICVNGVCGLAETTLHTFVGGSDGAVPLGSVVFDPQGNLYGTTQDGGTYNLGTVYKATLSGGTWNYSVIHSFGGPGDGGYPGDPLVMDSAGNLYGTTQVGGSGYGTVFELSPSQGGWTETILYSFTGNGDGCLPIAGLVFDGKGNLYGATDYCPTIFELSPQPGGGWNFTTLYTFPGTGPYHGPSSSLTVDAAGNVYGATTNDGAYGYGNVFKMSPSGSGWTYTDLHDFTNGSDGGQPYGGVVVTGPTGYLYGTTYYGGTGVGESGGGVIYQINLAH